MNYQPTHYPFFHDTTSSWSLRGAITATIYGFECVENDVVDFFMDPIVPANQGLSDFDSVTRLNLVGIRALLNKIPQGEKIAWNYCQCVCGDVLQHFRFHLTYVARGGRLAFTGDEKILNFGKVFSQRFKESLKAFNLGAAIDTAPETELRAAAAKKLEELEELKDLMVHKMQSSEPSFFRDASRTSLTLPPAVEQICWPDLARRDEKGEQNVAGEKRASPIARREPVPEKKSKLDGADVNLWPDHVDELNALARFEGTRSTEDREKEDSVGTIMDLYSEWKSRASIEPVLSQFVDTTLNVDGVKKSLLARSPDDVAAILDACLNANGRGEEDEKTGSRKTNDPKKLKNSADRQSRGVKPPPHPEDGVDSINKAEDTPQLEIGADDGQNEAGDTPVLENCDDSQIGAPLKLDGGDGEQIEAEVLAKGDVGQSEAEATPELDKCGDSQSEAPPKLDDGEAEDNPSPENGGETSDLIVELLGDSNLRKNIPKVDEKLAAFVNPDGFSYREVRRYLRSLTCEQAEAILTNCLNLANPSVEPADGSASGPTSKEDADKDVNISMIIKILEDENVRYSVMKTHPTLSPYLAGSWLDKEETESLKSVLRKSSIAELGQMTISFMDVQQLHRSVAAQLRTPRPTSVSKAPDDDDDDDAVAEVKICEREDSDYSFTPRDVIDGCITGKALFDKVQELLPGVKPAYVSAAADSNAIVDNCQASLEEFVNAILQRDPSVVGGINSKTLRPKFLRYRMLPSAGSPPPDLKKIYDLVASKFEDRGNLIRLDYIQVNEDLAQTFYDEKNNFQSSGFSDEELLFHGTDVANIGSIFSSNFDPKAEPKRRRKAAAHGPGVYFSASISTAFMYTFTGTITLSRVLLGRAGVHDLRADESSAFHSRRVGREIVVIKSPSQILPFCVLNFKSKENRHLGRSQLQARAWRMASAYSSYPFPKQASRSGNIVYQGVHGFVLNGRVYDPRPCGLCKKHLSTSCDKADPLNLDADWILQLRGCSHYHHFWCVNSARDSSPNITCPSCGTVTSPSTTGCQPLFLQMEAKRSKIPVGKDQTLDGVVLTFSSRNSYGAGILRSGSTESTFDGLSFPRVAVFPGTERGQRVLRLVKAAFWRRLLFIELRTRLVIWEPVTLKESLADIGNDLDGYLTGIENGLRKVGVSRADDETAENSISTAF